MVKAVISSIVYKITSGIRGIGRAMAKYPIQFGFPSNDRLKNVFVFLFPPTSGYAHIIKIKTCTLQAC